MQQRTILHTAFRREWLSRLLLVACIGCVLLAAHWAGALDPERYREMLPTLWTLATDAWPPDFERLPNWGKPLLDTLAMSVAGTAGGVLAALPLGALAARGLAPAPVRHLVMLLLNTVRSIPGLLWGIIFVASVGFGPLPGALALACHSAGMLGKFFAEIFEHVDRAPVDALRSQGVTILGVLRFGVLPQVLPRLVDVSLYRWEHNIRAATTLGVIGAGGLGLEIITAFHLFEYREALALIGVLLALVTVVNLLGAYIRRRFLDYTTA
ncbi:phosphonate transport system permease protein [Azomonas macrocytogenes]|uniref:Phosphonate transport system permease protein n=2 Tax=Azomonas macrocytogenes TaxID=69962 RepID=A0A839T3X4_AZOMA|nr:phosphonate ABC transporter, permease protein PhnE [Azomonas macrocytogenes]MBB3103186.1 phosphonate transport system permease protein [Azomonas macrocytogenes]